MELTNDFRVRLPVDEAWELLTDIARIAPCLPGARLEDVDGDDYQGTLTVRIGSVTTEYRGRATFKTLDRDAGRMVMRGEGQEPHGQSNAEVTLTATLRPEGDNTRVTVVVEFTVTGRIAQFGRGVMADVSAKLIRQFSECLDAEVRAAAAVPAPEPPPEPVIAHPPVPEAVTELEPEPEPAPATVVSAEQIDAPAAPRADVPVAATGPDTGERSAGPAVAEAPSWSRRLPPVAPVLVGIAVVWILMRFLRRRRA